MTNDTFHFLRFFIGKPAARVVRAVVQVEGFEEKPLSERAKDLAEETKTAASTAAEEAKKQASVLVDKAKAIDTTQIKEKATVALEQAKNMASTVVEKAKTLVEKNKVEQPSVDLSMPIDTLPWYKPGMTAGEVANGIMYGDPKGKK